MTIGQRIAQKRKELGLSQEALGARLNVSRQSIYKWERDANLPEVEKLIALAQLLGVSVGWLLGVEEAAEPGQPEAPDTLSETQLQMVDQIVRRYLDAQPKRIKLRIASLAAAALVLVVVFSNLFSRLRTLDNRYQSLQSSVSGISGDVNAQISGISGRVEEILKAQNSLTAEYGSELLGLDLFQGGSSATFSVYAVPKTYQEGMTAEFWADNGKEITTVPVSEIESGKFSAQLRCNLSNLISLSVVFVLPDGTRQTQLLEDYYNLLLETFPNVSVSCHRLFAEDVIDGVLTLTDRYATVSIQGPQQGDAAVEEIQPGVFRNRELIAWAEPCDMPETFQGFSEQDQYYRLPNLTIPMGSEDTLQIAALVTDSYGRQFITSEIPMVVENETEGTPYLTYASDGRYSSDPADWVLD